MCRVLFLVFVQISPAPSLLFSQQLRIKDFGKVMLGVFKIAIHIFVKFKGFKIVFDLIPLRVFYSAVYLLAFWALVSIVLRSAVKSIL